MRLVWGEDAWSEYVEWQSQDTKTLKKINQLIKSIQRDGKPMGKAEYLKHRGPGLASVRIDKYNRLVYRIEGDDLLIIGCKGHYED